MTYIDVSHGNFHWVLFFTWVPCLIMVIVLLPFKEDQISRGVGYSRILHRLPPTWICMTKTGMAPCLM